jgi:hypothetical protein
MINSVQLTLQTKKRHDLVKATGCAAGIQDLKDSNYETRKENKIL